MLTFATVDTIHVGVIQIDQGTGRGGLAVRRVYGSAYQNGFAFLRLGGHLRLPGNIGGSMPSSPPFVTLVSNAVRPNRIQNLVVGNLCRTIRFAAESER